MPDAGETNTAIAVVGGGPVGLTAAIAIAAAGVETVLIGKRPDKPDNRTTALLAGSVAALDALGVWAGCAAQSAPLRVMRLVDDTGRLFRAPQVTFDAGEIGLEAFGHNIENRHLLAALDVRARALASLRIVETQVREIECGERTAAVRLADGGTIEAALVIGADGRRSLCRAAAGIEVAEREYLQSALTLSFSHTRAHRNVSTEFHTTSGPLTQVPLPGNRSSLVWVLQSEQAEEFFTLQDEELSTEIERGLHSILGKVRVEPGRGLFALTIGTAKRFSGKRIALVGEAAHVIPPIGAQGLNLGLRDASAIAELVVGALRAGNDPGAPTLLRRYGESRRDDVGSRSLAVDLLNRSLLSDLLPVQSARGLGLYLMDRVGPLRRAVMREGIRPGSARF
ncbi:MAG: UbiH/UbiF family hydroxylase [Pseudolabrys sp.]